MIAYATAPGSVAADGDGANGLYTSKLVEAIKQPGLPVEEVFKRVRANVAQASRDQQTPWEASSLVGNFYFQGPTTVIINQPAPKQQAAAPVAPPAAGSAFDGIWMTTIVCTPASDGAKGYTMTFPAQVRDGELSGQYQARGGGEGGLMLKGRINPDGGAVLSASGITTHPELTVGRVPRGSQYNYTAIAKFEGTKGSGTRNELRPCTLSFTKM
jgi:hypothetical protein